MIINFGNFTEANIVIEDPNKDLMSLRGYGEQACLATLVTKNAEFAINPFFMHTDNSKLGFMVKTGKDNFRIQLGGEFDPCIYRGQNKDYEHIIPSLQRIDKNKNFLDYCVAWIQCEEFKETFKRTPYYNRLSQMRVLGNTFEFDLEALAQHYGFATNYVDTTTDFSVAMFFAYTKYNNGCYHPITDFEEYSPVLYVTQIQNFIFPTSKNNCEIVGFQSTLRPLTQKAMAIDCQDYVNLKSSFRKIELPKDASYALGIYNSFHKGAKLFPREPVALIAQEIIDSKHINIEILKKFCEINNHNYEELSKELSKMEYRLDDLEIIFSENQLCQMHFEISTQILPWIEKNIGYRGWCHSAK